MCPVAKASPDHSKDRHGTKTGYFSYHLFQWFLLNHSSVPQSQYCGWSWRGERLGWSACVSRSPSQSRHFLKLEVSSGQNRPSEEQTRQQDNQAWRIPTKSSCLWIMWGGEVMGERQRKNQNRTRAQRKSSVRIPWHNSNQRRWRPDCKQRWKQQERGADPRQSLCEN